MVDLPDKSRWNLNGHTHAERIVIGDECDEPRKHDMVGGARFQTAIMAKLRKVPRSFMRPDQGHVAMCM